MKKKEVKLHKIYIIRVYLLRLLLQHKLIIIQLIIIIAAGRNLPLSGTFQKPIMYYFPDMQ